MVSSRVRHLVDSMCKAFSASSYVMSQWQHVVLVEISYEIVHSGLGITMNGAEAIVADAASWARACFSNFNGPLNEFAGHATLPFSLNRAASL